MTYSDSTISIVRAVQKILEGDRLGWSQLTTVAKGVITLDGADEDSVEHTPAQALVLHALDGKDSVDARTSVWLGLAGMANDRIANDRHASGDGRIWGEQEYQRTRVRIAAE